MNYEMLIHAGVDMDSLLNRLMGNGALIQRFIQKFAEDETFLRLEQAIAAQDWKAAEMASHTLKGMCGNLSVTTLYPLFTEQTNLIRAGKLSEAKAMMPQITQQYRESMQYMKAFLAQQ